MTRTIRSIAALGAALALFAACGGSTDDAAESTTTAPPTTTVAPAPALDADAVWAVLGEGDPETEAMIAGLSDADIECLFESSGIDPDTLDAEAMLDDEVTTALGLAIIDCALPVVAEAMAAEMGITVDQATCLLDADGLFMQILLDDGEQDTDLSDEEGMQMFEDLFQAMADCGIEMDDLTVGDGVGEDTGGGFVDEAELDQLAEDCRAGDMEACDTLYFFAEYGSEYEELGSTCGGTSDPTLGGCAGGLGGDVDLDALAADCEGGDMEACDTLYFASPYGSEYEEIAATCGGTRDAEFGGICAAG